MAARPKIVFAIVGTFGDLHPFLAIALELQTLGCEPVIAAAESYRAKVSEEGLAFTPLRPDLKDLEGQLGVPLDDLVRRMRDGEGGLPVRDTLGPFLRSTYDDAFAATEGAAVLVTNHLGFVAALAAEKRGLPHVFGVVQPGLFFSPADPPKIGPVPLLQPDEGEDLGGLKLNWNRALLWGMRRLSKVSLAKPVRALRDEVGLPHRPGDPFMDQARRATLSLGLYSPLLGGPRSDELPNDAVTGFAIYDRDSGGPIASIGSDDGAGTQERLDGEVEQFLAAGAPPLMFTLGSIAVLAAGDFYDASVAAARALGRRALILMTAEQRDVFRARIGDAPDVLPCGYLRYSLVFPRAEAVIHHAGVGTAALVMRAGKPHLLVPSIADQPDNAARVARLGVGRILPLTDYTAVRATEELRSLLSEPAYAAKAAELKSKVVAENGAAEAARRIKALIEA